MIAALLLAAVGTFAVVAVIFREHRPTTRGRDDDAGAGFFFSDGGDGGCDGGDGGGCD